ncbi:MAG TPA: hypothetical protein DCZ95_10710 [Verrucomicrobia bacterium]|nr:MAG: hypothetical protein A2X46_18435 [Lentisphaerae bacterium GWF2_57_35]HBA84554.1 hypothetical protein [Verrucomicrobiota bacterium]
MANIMLTTACNFRCDYCFGRQLIGPEHPIQMMDPDLYRRLLDWIDAANMPNLDVHLMGGEPTLHPKFSELAEELVQRGRKAVVFSNLSAPLPKEVLERCVENDVMWVVNANAPSSYLPVQLEHLHRNLAVVGDQAMLTFNITGPDTDFDYIFDLIAQHKLAHSIKIGITLPTLDHQNAHVKREQYPGVAKRVMELHEEALRQNVRIEFECGVAYCVFSPAQRALLKDIHISHCGSRLDITPWGEVINCLPLCKAASIAYDRFAHYGEAVHWYRRALHPYRGLGNSTTCPDCAHMKEGRCGVCLADTLWQMDHIAWPPQPAANSIS